MHSHSLGKLILPLLSIGLPMALSACAPRSAGSRILDDLRADGLIAEDAGAVRPAGAMHGGTAPLEVGLGLPADGNLTVDMLLEAADRLNPRIAAARAALGAAGGRSWNAALYPNPSIGVESENVRVTNGGFGVSETTVSVNQPIIVTDRRNAAIAAGRAQMNAQRWTLAQVRRDVHGRVRREMAEIINIRRSIALHRELIVLADHTLNIAQTRFEARAAPESEAIRARVESNTLSLNVERLEGELAAARARLSALLGGRDIDVNRLVEAPTRRTADAALTNVDALQQRVRDRHPAVRAAESDVEAAQRRVELERARRQPDINTHVGVGVDHAADETFVEVGVGVPLPIFDDNRGAVLAAQFDVIRARRVADATADELAGAVAEAFHRWRSASGRLDVYEQQILRGAQRAYDQTRDGYQAGRLPFLDLLDAQRTLIEASIARIELIRAVDGAAADLHAILGEDLNPETSGDESS